MADVLEALYPSSEKHKRKRKFHNVFEDVQSMHRKLWPSVTCPKIIPVDELQEASFGHVMPTSMVVATLAWGWTASKRSPDSKQLCGMMLKALIQNVTKHEEGVEVSFPVVEADGTAQIRQQVVLSDGVVDCWTDSMSEAVGTSWDSSVLDASTHFPKSPRNQTQLYDFIMWSLEPTPVNSREPKLKKCRALLAASALTLLTNVASAIESRYIPFLFAEMAKPGGHNEFSIQSSTNSKRRRLNTLTANVVSAGAMELLFRGEDSNCNCSRTVRTYLLLPPPPPPNATCLLSGAVGAESVGRFQQDSESACGAVGAQSLRILLAR